MFIRLCLNPLIHQRIYLFISLKPKLWMNLKFQISKSVTVGVPYSFQPLFVPFAPYRSNILSEFWNESWNDKGSSSRYTHCFRIQKCFSYTVVDALSFNFFEVKLPLFVPNFTYLEVKSYRSKILTKFSKESLNDKAPPTVKHVFKAGYWDQTNILNLRHVAMEVAFQFSFSRAESEFAADGIIASSSEHCGWFNLKATKRQIR